MGLSSLVRFPTKFNQADALKKKKSSRLCRNYSTLIALSIRFTALIVSHQTISQNDILYSNKTTMYPYCVFCTFTCPARPDAGRFSCSRLRGTQGPRMYTTAQVWAPAGLRGARSRRLKSRDLASQHGITFCLAEPHRTTEIPQIKFCFHCCCCC